MRAPRTPEEFIRLLEKSQLLKRSLFEKIKPQLEQFGAEGDTPERLAKSLVKNRILTPYQSAQLLKGRWNGFYIGKYRLLDLLGRGGMGKVYLAEQITMQRVVAVKVVRPRAASNRVNLARFVREARAVAQLRHPNVVQAYDFDAFGGVPYIVMEYIEGLNCDEILLHFGPVPYPQACDFIMQAAEGLQHAYELGLVHRDIKPGNLIVESTGTLKILDLGLVTCLGPEDGQLTKRDEHVGTADYLAPEQGLDSRDVDIRADIYSLGCTLYHLLAGHPVFPDRSATQKLLLHQTTMPTPIRNIVPDVPEELEAILNRMLAKKREDRFQTPAELAEALEPFAERKVPPFDLSAIRFKLKDLEPFLKRGPSPSSIIGRHSLDSQIVKRTAQATDDDSVVTEGVVDPELRAILAGVEDAATETQQFLEGEKHQAAAQPVDTESEEHADVGVAVAREAAAAASGSSVSTAVAVAAPSETRPRAAERAAGWDLRAPDGNGLRQLPASVADAPPRDEPAARATGGAHEAAPAATAEDDLACFLEHDAADSIAIVGQIGRPVARASESARGSREQAGSTVPAWAAQLFARPATWIAAVVTLVLAGFAFGIWFAQTGSAGGTNGPAPVQQASPESADTAALQPSR